MSNLCITLEQGTCLNMRFRTIKVLLILFVCGGQVMAASGASSCDMNMHEIVMMDHAGMDMSDGAMNKSTMDCCDSRCEMDCSLSMVSVLIESPSMKTTTTSSAKIMVPQDITALKSLSSLYHPPISA